MARRRPRDIERVYSAGQCAGKLRRFADAVERERPFTIRVAGETLRVPAGAAFTVEHERAADGTEEIEFQLRWTTDGVRRRRAPAPRRRAAARRKRG